MSRLWKIFRAVVLSLIALAVGLPVGLYMVLSTPWAQDQLCRIASEELSALLSARVTIGRVMLHPFNRLSVYDVSAMDDYGKRALSIDEVSAGFELRHFLATGNIIVDYALIDGANITLYKETPESPLNIAAILDKLRSKDQQQRTTRFDLRINTVILRNAALTYDVLSQPQRNGFDHNHVKLTALNLNASVPRLSNEQYTVELDRLDFREASGFILSGLTVKADVRTNGITMGPLQLDMPNSHVIVSPMSLSFERFEQLPELIRSTPIRVEIAQGSNVYLPDLKSFVPGFSDFPVDLDLQLVTKACLNHIDLSLMHVADRDGLVTLDMRGSAERPDCLDSLTFDLQQLKVSGDLARAESKFGHVLPASSKILDKLGRIRLFELDLSANGDIAHASVNAHLSTPRDAIRLRAEYATPDTFKTVDLNSHLELARVDLGQITGLDKLGDVSATVDASGRIMRKKFSGKAHLISDRLVYDGYVYRNIDLSAELDPLNGSAKLAVDDPNLKISADVAVDYASALKHLWLDLRLEHAYLAELGLTDRYQGYGITGNVSADLSGSDIDDLMGSIQVTDCKFKGSTDGIKLDSLCLDINRTNDYTTFTISSDYINGSVEGRIAMSSLPGQLTTMFSRTFPALGITPKGSQDALNRFNYSFTISDAETLCDFFKLPVRSIYPVAIDGYIDSHLQHADLTIDIPYLQQGDKVIENSALFAKLDGVEHRALVYGTTTMPTKKGPLSAVFTLTGSENRVDSHIDWLIDRRIPINGLIDFSTLLGKDDEDRLTVDVDFNRSDITFGDEVWAINPAHLRYAGNVLGIDSFSLTADDQAIVINGQAGPDMDNVINISLNKVELLEIFETLEIDKALIGGKATGVIEGKALFSKQPVIETEKLYVKDISYNRCELGDAIVMARFDNEKTSFYLDADVTEEDGRHSHIYGDIFPATESLDIKFDADRVKVGFMKPFMEAFASDVRGYASGHAHLFGTFKYIDMEGDIFADSLQIKIDFTNTWYSATDSIHLQPGVINIDDVVVYDAEGHMAKLNGVVKHKFFKEPSFDFKVTDARNFLSYDVDANLSPDWYGHIYGNGSAFINGYPGVVNISVNMTTAPGSSFTFVLSDQLVAEEYQFITFRPKPGTVQVREDFVPQIVRDLKNKSVNQTTDAPSAYNMDIQVDINPDVAMTIVMDPVGGDDIKCTGYGNMRMTYESLNNDLRMQGTYTLDEGQYHFTLQDIIIKDFLIEKGSSIAFYGDPYNAQLDIKAVYQVNANLSDLDKSFLQDKDLKQTNVPVQAVLNVSGEMRQPDIKLDLNFPTLNQDIYRKVRSIVSTEDMMNRQIIYLMALGRFYTPDYMASTTKGNEVFAVASSTISSQLGSMLGKLSDKWSIAPNLRSDRGDFSDVELDVALSSRLLNNRLLFNGNFGYRDKSLNTNQFIGDFDIEYLLNNTGTWRLKAYNRYNDQNYYLRTAATTQGVGVVFRKDFDDFFKFLRHRKKSKDETPSAASPDEIAPRQLSPTDSVPAKSDPSDGSE